MKKFALIVAGGSGNRMKSNIPKQFVELHEKPVLLHTLEAFLKADPAFEFVVVLAPGRFREWREVCSRHNFEAPQTLVAGGATRFESVKNGLAQIQEEGVVFIHDGVRPLVSVATIKNCYEMAVEKGNALPVVAPSESVRKVENDTNKAVDRSRYFLVQTPQTFKVDLIKKAYGQEYAENFTDDASVLENYGYPIYLVEGNRHNIKLTYPEDLALAEIYLKAKQ
ncbi:MAG: 2-C-methyl-D-erythritol 4-phosphate cytidylyltransferase [Prolixibacteraceae bacterium]